ncbi:hypothetical protein Clacol_002954 [Clathrus columnatus]|uniref:Uncharacterized protein n=1 Tax=Clathrus columnatus TaxID=1419009 RepID=A0AAV5A6Z4_9AGAM|nr:hypothetical protein Clacol_002954 [Clathrus columnatus]
MSVHTFQATFYQTWWFSLAVLFTGALEIAGWGLRLRSSQNPLDISAFHSQYSVLFIAPLPIYVAIWGSFLKIVPRLGGYLQRGLHSLYVQLLWILYIAILVLEAVGVGEVSNATRVGGQVLFAGSYIYIALLILSNVLALDIVTRYDAAKVLDALEEVYARKRNNRQLIGIYHPGQFHKDGPLSHESVTSSNPSSPRMTHKQLPRINTNIVWKPRPQPGQQPLQEKVEQEKGPAPSRVVYAGGTRTTPPTL